MRQANTGQYRVSVTWFEGSGYFDDTAQFSVFDGVALRGGKDPNQQLSPDDRYVDGVGFEDVGIFNILGDTLTVRLRGDDPLLFVLADAVQIERLGDVPEGPEIAVFEGERDVQAGIVGFGTVELNESVEKTFTIANQGTIALDLFGSISVPFGYTLVTFPTPTLNPGETTTFTVRLEATLPGEFGGEIFFGNSDADEGTFVFEVSGTVLPTRIMDNGQSGYSQTGDFQTAALSIAHDGDVSYAVGGAAPSEATWTFSVTPGWYLIAATWFDTAGSTFYADNAPFTIFDGDMLVADVSVNQQFAPDDVSDVNGNWELLWSPIFIANSTLTVRLTNVSANGYVLADAVRIERVGDFPSGANIEPAQGVTFVKDPEPDTLDASLANIYRIGELDETAAVLMGDFVADAADELSDGIATGVINREDFVAIDLALTDWL
ncbi:MAG: choice-of-anchor D domain-containing protein [Planctomycetes bacterium]|nr:choice-of-anchor D domain-containing protein [Planctomycetota bacterium]